LTSVQHRLGDSTPLFGLFLSPSTAKQAVPTLAVLAVSGLVVSLLRGSDVRRAA
jgi:hypothetical protein